MKSQTKLLSGITLLCFGAAAPVIVQADGAADGAVSEKTIVQVGIKPGDRTLEHFFPVVTFDFDLKDAVNKDSINRKDTLKEELVTDIDKGELSGQVVDLTATTTPWRLDVKYDAEADQELSEKTWIEAKAADNQVLHISKDATPVFAKAGGNGVEITDVSLTDVKMHLDPKNFIGETDNSLHAGQLVWTLTDAVASEE